MHWSVDAPGTRHLAHRTSEMKDKSKCLNTHNGLLLWTEYKMIRLAVSTLQSNLFPNSPLDFDKSMKWKMIGASASLTPAGSPQSHVCRIRQNHKAVWCPHACSGGTFVAFIVEQAWRRHRPIEHFNLFHRWLSRKLYFFYAHTLGKHKHTGRSLHKDHETNTFFQTNGARCARVCVSVYLAKFIMTWLSSSGVRFVFVANENTWMGAKKKKKKSVNDFS